MTRLQSQDKIPPLQCLTGPLLQGKISLLLGKMFLLPSRGGSGLLRVARLGYPTRCLWRRRVSLRVVGLCHTMSWSSGLWTCLKQQKPKTMISGSLPSTQHLSLLPYPQHLRRSAPGLRRRGKMRREGLLRSQTSLRSGEVLG